MNLTPRRNKMDMILNKQSERLDDETVDIDSSGEDNDEEKDPFSDDEDEY